MATPLIAKQEPATCHIVGTIPRITAFMIICTIAFVLMIALVGPASPFTMAFRAISDVNISKEDDKVAIVKL